MTKKLCFQCAVLVAMAVFSWPSSTSEAEYQQGMKAIAAHDYSNGLLYLEQAVSGEPNNVRYANDYRQAAIRGKEFDRSLKFFEKTVADHPNSANLHLNFGFAYVDKIPVAGAITQVILANNALNEFTKALQLEPSWIGYYTRGESYLFWPKVFNRAPLGVSDLEKALEVQKKESRRNYHVKTYIALGDGYWKTDQLDKAKAAWQAGLKEFPGNEQLKSRLSLQGDELKAAIEAQFDPNKRVDTDLRELWSK
jgi:tetratricopeptide (TPR) repeat protein